MYQLNFTQTALKTLKKIDKSVTGRILDKIEWMTNNIDQVTPISLKGEYSEFYKLRIGNYRVIYDVDFNKLEITIHFIGHRSDIYK